MSCDWSDCMAAGNPSQADQVTVTNLVDENQTYFTTKTHCDMFDLYWWLENAGVPCDISVTFKIRGIFTGGIAAPASIKLGHYDKSRRHPNISNW